MLNYCGVSQYFKYNTVLQNNPAATLMIDTAWFIWILWPIKQNYAKSTYTLTLTGTTVKTFVLYGQGSIWEDQWKNNDSTFLRRHTTSEAYGIAPRLHGNMVWIHIFPQGTGLRNFMYSCVASPSSWSSLRYSAWKSKRICSSYLASICIQIFQDSK